MSFKYKWVQIIIYKLIYFFQRILTPFLNLHCFLENDEKYFEFREQANSKKKNIIFIYVVKC